MNQFRRLKRESSIWRQELRKERKTAAEMVEVMKNFQEDEVYMKNAINELRQNEIYMKNAINELRSRNEALEIEKEFCEKNCNQWYLAYKQQVAKALDSELRRLAHMEYNNAFRKRCEDKVQ